MASIFIEFEVPDSLKEHFKTVDLNPFERLVLSVKVDRDRLTELLQETLQEVRYQKQRDNETLAQFGLPISQNVY